MKKPSIEDQEKCFRLRCASRRGQRMLPEEMAYFEKMYNEYPEWYESIEDRIYEETKPFGAI